MKTINRPTPTGKYANKPKCGNWLKSIANYGGQLSDCELWFGLFYCWTEHLYGFLYLPAL